MQKITKNIRKIFFYENGEVFFLFYKFQIIKVKFKFKNLKNNKFNKKVKLNYK